MDTAGGVERSLYRILQVRVGLAAWDDAYGDFSVSENFIVIPKLSRDTVLVGLSFLRKPVVGGIVDDLLSPGRGIATVACSLSNQALLA
jgi:hypothetical protein